MKNEQSRLNINLTKVVGVGFFILSFFLLTYSIFSIPDGDFSVIGVKLPVFTTPFERLISISTVCVMLWGLGYSVSLRLFEDKRFFETQCMRMLIGLGVFPFISMVLNTPAISFPIDVKLFLAISLIVPIIDLIKKFSSSDDSFSLNFSVNVDREFSYFAVVFCVAALTLAVLSTGAFSYPWMEDGDAWRHAGGVKYIATQRTYVLPEGVPVSDTLEPYPPSYDALMALVNQLNNSTQWSMKFFTSFLAALGVVGLYFFIKKFSGNPEIAVLSAVIMALMPSYSSHFIWAYTLGFILFFPAFYSLEHIRDDKRWMIPAILQVAGLMLIQALIAPTFGVFFIIYWLVRAVKQRSLLPKILAVGAIGLMLSMWIFWVPMYQKYWGKNAGKLNDIDSDFSKGVFKIDHEGRTYPISEFMSAPKNGNIAVHHGVGPILFPLFLLTVALIIYSYKSTIFSDKYWISVMFSWTLFSFIGIQSYTLPIHFLPGRFWMIITFPVAVVSAWGLLEISKHLKGSIDSKIIVLAVILGIALTSGLARYSVQTAVWPMDFFHKYRGHLDGYLSLLNLDPDTPVFTFCMEDDKVISFDKLGLPWDKEVQEFRGWSFPYRGLQDSTEDIVLNRGRQETYDFLKSKGFSYAILCPECLTQCLTYHSEPVCIQKYQDYAMNLSMQKGLTAHQVPGSLDIIYQVN